MGYMVLMCEFLHSLISCTLGDCFLTVLGYRFLEHPWSNLTDTFLNLEGAAAGG